MKRKILKFIVLTLSVLVMTLIFTVPTSAETNLSANTIYQNGTTTVTADVPSNTASITWRCVPSGIVSFGTATRSGNTYTVIATGAKLGTATISAIATDSSGNKTTITIGTIYVVLEDGIYTVRNNYTDQNFTGDTYYLRSQTSTATTVLAAQHTQSIYDNWEYKIYNHWAITHLGNGEYVIRTFIDNTLALEYSNGKVAIASVDESNSTVHEEARWYIVGNNIKPKSDVTKCLILSSSTPSSSIYSEDVYYNYFNLSVNTIGDMAFEKWTFEYNYITVLMFKKKTTGQLKRTFLETYHIDKSTVNFSELMYEFKIYTYDSSIVKSISWESDDETVADVDSSTGNLSLIGGGRAKITITVTFDVNGFITTPELCYTIDVYVIEEGTYFIKNMGNELNMDVENPLLLENNNANSDINVINNTFDRSINQKWGVTHVNSNIYIIYQYNSDRSKRFFLSIENDSYSYNTNIVMRSGTNITDGMKWKLEKGANGYRFVSCLENNTYAISPYSIQIGVNIVTTPNRSDSQYNNEWGFFDTYFTIVNYYDDSFGLTLQNYIDDANVFVNTVMFREYDLEYKMEGEPVYNGTIIPNCTGLSSQCNTPNCGNCVYHHKNVINISNTLYNKYRKNNHVYVMWSDRDTAFCETTNTGNHLLFKSLACVCYFRPVIHVTNITGQDNIGDTLTDTSQQKKACMALTLLHEMMHTFELPDQYENGDWHGKADEDYHCIMEIYEKDYAVNYYQKLLFDDELTKVFCDDCTAKFSNLNISTKQYIGNLGGER